MYDVYYYYKKGSTCNNDHMYNGIELFRLIYNNQILEKINMFHYNRNDISSVD